MSSRNVRSGLASKLSGFCKPLQNCIFTVETQFFGWNRLWRRSFLIATKQSFLSNTTWLDIAWPGTAFIKQILNSVFAAGEGAYVLTWHSQAKKSVNNHSNKKDPLWSALIADFYSFSSRACQSQIQSFASCWKHHTQQRPCVPPAREKFFLCHQEPGTYGTPRIHSQHRQTVA